MTFGEPCRRCRDAHPCCLRSRNLAAQSAFDVVSIPPSPVLITFWMNEKHAMSPRGRPIFRIAVPKDLAAIAQRHLRSVRGLGFGRISTIREDRKAYHLMDQRMARVLGVIASSFCGIDIERRRFDIDKNGCGTE